MTTVLGRILLLVCLLASPALGQTYPDRNVTIVVTSAAGALTDVLTRAVAQRLSEKVAAKRDCREPWRAPVIRSQHRTLSGPSYDGYTLLSSEIGFYTTQPHLYAKGKIALRRGTGLRSGRGLRHDSGGADCPIRRCR